MRVFGRVSSLGDWKSPIFCPSPVAASFYFFTVWRVSLRKPACSYFGDSLTAQPRLALSLQCPCLSLPRAAITTMSFTSSCHILSGMYVARVLAPGGHFSGFIFPSQPAFFSSSGLEQNLSFGLTPKGMADLSASSLVEPSGFLWLLFLTFLPKYQKAWYLVLEPLSAALFITGWLISAINLIELRHA